MNGSTLQRIWTSPQAISRGLSECWQTQQTPERRNWLHARQSIAIDFPVKSEGLHLDSEGHAHWGHMLNTHLYWNHRARRPAFSYLLMSRRRPAPTEGAWRLGMASAVMAGSGICVGTLPSAPAGQTPEIWDEMVGGRDVDRPGWLGKPLGPVRRLAFETPDLIEGCGAPPSPPLVERCELHNARATLEAGALVLRGADDAVQSGIAGEDASPDTENGEIVTRMRLRDAQPAGRDLVVAIRLRGQARRDCPPEADRLFFVTPTREGQRLLANRNRWDVNARRHGYFHAEADFLNVFYFNDLPPGALDLDFEFEGGEAVWIEELRLFAAPDACCRVFENGLALANPAMSPYKFDLAALAPGSSFRRIKGSRRQYPDVNSGEALGEHVTLGPHDALFAIRG